jgi:hypothetical protein
MTPELHLELNQFPIELVEGNKFLKDAAGKHSVQMHGSIGNVADPTFGRCATLDAADYSVYPGDDKSHFSVSSNDLTNDVVTVGAWVYMDGRTDHLDDSIVFTWLRTNQEGTRWSFAMWFVLSSRQSPRAALVVPGGTGGRIGNYARPHSGHLFSIPGTT